MKKILLSLSFIWMGLYLSAQSPRLCLFEEFTGETCPPCAGTNPNLNTNLLSALNATRIISIKWQVPIPSAPSNTWSLYQTNKAEIDWRYRSTNGGGYGYPSQNNANSSSSSGINSAPSGRIDGQHLWAFGATSDHPQYLWASQGGNNVISTAHSYTSAFSISMTREWNYNCSAVNLTVTINATAPFTSVGNLIFRTVMVERQIHFATQPGTNGEKDFEDVAIKSFPSLQGGVTMAGSWTVGQSQTFTLSCPIPSYVRSKEEVALVGFIQDDGDRKVAQAGRADKDLLPIDAASVISPYVNATCSNMVNPIVTVSNDGQVNAITVMTITPYIDGVAGVPTVWNGNIPVGASTQITLTPVTTPTANGAHTFSCDVAMNLPSFNLVQNLSKTKYLVATLFNGSPVAEGFVSTTYPPAGWMTTNSDNGPSWSRNAVAGGFNTSTQSSKYDFYSNTVIGDQDELYLPPLDLSGGNNIQMSFDVAYAQKDIVNNDVLDVLASSDCGQTWSTVYSNYGIGLATVPPYSFPAWMPSLSDPSEWRKEVFMLPNFNQAQVLLKFVTTNDGGNNLYIDNINIEQKDPVGISSAKATDVKVQVYPNPASSSATVKLTAGEASEGTISVINTLGQTVYTQAVTFNSGVNTFDVDVRSMASGIYNVVIVSGKGSVVKKLNVIK